MTALESMINKLSPLGVYNLNSDTVIYAELAAFAVGLDVYRESLETLLRECFVATAESYGIENRELAVGKPREDLLLEKRREMLFNRLSFSAGDFTPEGLKKALSFIGIDGTVSEQPEAQRISIFVADGEYPLAEREWISAQIKGILPAHLEWDVVFSGFSWSVSDSKSNTFSVIDGKGYNWKKIDCEL